MIKNSELYSFQEEEEENEPGEEVIEAQESDQQSPGLSRLISQTIITFLSLILVLLVCKTHLPWGDWLRVRMHNAVNTSSEVTFGRFLNSPLVQSVVENSRNLVRLERITNFSQPNIVDAPEFQTSVWPVNGNMTKGFGWSYNPGTHTREFFRGIEIAALPDSEVYAIASGEISNVINRPTEGWSITITHGNSWKSVYNHLYKVRVNIGQIVKAGTVIAQLNPVKGSTPVLGLELLNMEEPVDPLTVLK